MQVVKRDNGFFQIDFQLNESHGLTGEIITVTVGRINMEPDAHRSTTIKSDEIKRLPRK